MKDEVVKMAETGDPTIEDKLRNRGVSMVRLGRHDYKTAQDLAQQVCLLSTSNKGKYSCGNL